MTDRPDAARWAAVRDAFSLLAGSAWRRAGGWQVDAGPLRFVPTDALWMPDAHALPGLRKEPDPPDLVTPAGGPLARAVRDGGWTAVAGLALTPPATLGGPRPSPAPRSGGARDRAWDGAAEVARLLVRDLRPADPGPPSASVAADEDATEATHALAVLLGSWASADPDLRLVLDDEREQTAVALDRPDLLLILLHAGGSELASGLVAEGVATGRDPIWVRAVPATDAQAELLRWSVAP
ncbi:MAG: hypothetical protein WD336_08570 [Trueperaceae bacterium]